MAYNPLTLTSGTAAGGTLAGTYPSPTLASNVTVQELNYTTQNVALVTTAANPLNGNIVRASAIAASATVAAPTSSTDGMCLIYVLPQDSTGGRIISWNATFKGVTSSTVNTLPNAVTTLKFVYQANVATPGWYLASSTVNGVGTWLIFADGSDGSGTLDGTTTVFNIVPNASTYSLPYDILAHNITINTGVTVITNGYRIFCTGTLTNNGTIHCGGSNATSSAAGANGAANNYGIVGIVGSAGNITGATTQPATASDTLGGQGGSGGAGSSGTSGACGTYTQVTSTNFMRSMPSLLTGKPPNGANRLCGQGGRGGGGDATNSGGGGGGGGGAVFIAAYTVAGTGTIHAKGGTGFSPVTGNCGGGGGGGGGLVVIISTSVSASAITGQTIQVTSGLGGSGVGTGAAGTSGSLGTKIVINPPF